MTKFITGTFRSVALIIAASSFVALNTNAQDVDRFYRIDKSLFEAMVKSHAIDLQYPVLIVAPNEGMALPTDISQNKRFAGVPITLYDNYTELEAGNKSLQFKLIPQYNDYDFKISNYNGAQYLMSSSGKLSIGTSSTVFTLNFNESDESCFLLQPNYKKNSTDYSIDYDENSKEFLLVSENMKGISLYMFDKMGFATAEASVSDDMSTISMNLNSDKDYIGTEVFIKYILNNGENVTVSDLIASEHCYNVSWPKNKLEPVIIPLPNYNQEATTLWAIPVLNLGTNPDAPVGPVFHSTYSDVSTGITSTEITADDATPIYYTIQGVRVSNPSAPGIYLCRRGSNVSKILIR